MKVGIVALALMLTAVGASVLSTEAEARPSPLEGCTAKATQDGAFVGCSNDSLCAWVGVGLGGSKYLGTCGGS